MIDGFNLKGLLVHLISCVSFISMTILFNAVLSQILSKFVETRIYLFHFCFFLFYSPTAGQNLPLLRVLEWFFCPFLSVSFTVVMETASESMLRLIPRHSFDSLPSVIMKFSHLWLISSIIRILISKMCRLNKSLSLLMSSCPFFVPGDSYSNFLIFMSVWLFLLV